MKKFIVRFLPDKCKGCELCAAVCPMRIIHMGSHVNGKGYRPAEIADMSSCIGCASCALICPDGAISIFENDGEDKA